MLGYDTSPVEIESHMPEQVEQAGLRRPSFVSSLWEKAREFAGKLDTKFPFSVTLQILAFILVMTWLSLWMPLRVSSINDYDLGWHMRSGEWIMQHHQLPRTDPFSITGGSSPWVAYSWTFSVLTYEIARNFDLQGIAAYSTLVWFATVLLIFMLVRGQGASFWRALALTAIAGNVMPRVISPRPGTITILLFIVLLHVLL